MESLDILDNILSKYNVSDNKDIEVLKDDEEGNITDFYVFYVEISDTIDFEKICQEYNNITTTEFKITDIDIVNKELRIHLVNKQFDEQILYY